VVPDHLDCEHLEFGVRGVPCDAREDFELFRDAVVRETEGGPETVDREEAEDVFFFSSRPPLDLGRFGGLDGC